SISWAFTATYATNWHPLTWLSHIMDIHFFGIKPGNHHLTNVLFHIANALLLFLVLRRMTNGLWQSAFVAALFALHPLHVESVAWVSERKDVLSTFFWIMTMWGYCRYVERPRTTRYVLVIFFFMLGLMAKPMLVTLPFVLLLMDYWPLKRFQFEKNIIGRLILEKVPLFALSAGSCIITYVAQQSGGAVVPMSLHPVTVRFANALVSYTAYIGKTIWPGHLSVIYPYQQILPWWKVAGACLLLISISLLAVRTIKRHPYLAVGWLWYVGTLVPVIGLVQVGGQAMADRYTYVPIIGLFIMISWSVPGLLERWNKKKTGFAVMGLVVLSILAVGSLVQLRYWKNTMTLFERADSVTDNNYMVHNNLGFAFLELGKTDEAIRHYRESIKVNPRSELSHNNLGLALQRKGNIVEAIHHYFEALRINPNYELAHNNLGLALVKEDRINEAIDHFSEAVKIKPDYADAHNNLGDALAKQDKTSEAIRHFSEALRIKPDFATVHNNLGSCLAKQGKVKEAIHHFSEALRIKPDLPVAHYNLGIILATQGHTAEAISHYHKALTISPDYGEALNNLAWIHATNKNPKYRDGKTAVRMAEQVCKIAGHNNPALLDTLAAAYAQAGVFEKACSTVQKAIELAETANNKEMAEEFRIRLELYRSGRPFYED
ncbi:MAG: tetratricopeptide repeat protein, partial [Desulfobacterales bacterium]|nr:tetratricopeptide repeat protein [Desulfobacterales bacterium]